MFKLFCKFRIGQKVWPIDDTGNQHHPDDGYKVYEPFEIMYYGKDKTGRLCVEISGMEDTAIDWPESDCFPTKEKAEAACRKHGTWRSRNPGKRLYEDY